MKLHLVTYADSDEYYQGQQKLIESASEFDYIHTFTRNDIIETEFYLKNKHILDEKRGGGYWIWKPFIILEVMKKISHFDVIVYHDSGRSCYDWKFTSPLKQYIDFTCDKMKGFGITFGPFINGEYCKRDCFKFMKNDYPEFHEHKQVSATWMICQKNTFCFNILNEWKYWCTYDRIVTDDESVYPELEKYKSHRHDQAILTNILIRLAHENKFEISHSDGLYEKNINIIGKHIIN